MNDEAMASERSDIDPAGEMADGSPRGRRSLWVAGGVIGALLLAVPAIAAVRAPAEDESSAGTPTPVAATPEHDMSDMSEHEMEHAATGDHGAEHTTDTTTPASGDHHHMDMPARLDHDPTEAQLDDARELIAVTEAATAKYADTAAAEADGFTSIGDGMTGVEHYVNQDRLEDEIILDPEQPESLVYRVNADGSRTLITVMYILTTGSTMDDVPDIAGNVTMWHDHDNLCFDPSTGRLSGFFNGQRCIPGGEHVQTAPMLHVWVTPNPCGPFAGTDGGQMTGSCIDDGTF